MANAEPKDVTFDPRYTPAPTEIDPRDGLLVDPDLETLAVFADHIHDTYDMWITRGAHPKAAYRAVRADWARYYAEAAIFVANNHTTQP